jgi:hypothetical protein
MKNQQRSKSVAPAFQLSLRVRHPSLNPADLSREFQVPADHSFRAGDPRPAGAGHSSTSVHTESYWLGTLDPGPWHPDISFPENQPLQLAATHLRTLAANSLGWALALAATQFFHRHAELLRRLHAEGGETSLLVALSPGEVGGFGLSPEVSRILGELGIALEFEVI